MADIDALAKLTDDMLEILSASKTRVADRSASEPVQPSLFDRCINICRDAKAITRNSIIRSVHHLPCTGGTLIAKCLAAMPNVVVLNEVDPLSTMDLDPAKPRFSPRDLGALLRMGDRAVSAETLIALFLNQLETLQRRTHLEGRRLIIRDHSASHFLAVLDPSVRSSVYSILLTRGKTASIVTVRDPIDSYLSMANLGWIGSSPATGWTGFLPATFEEYCRRYLLFLDAHATLPIFRYENFVANPAIEMAKICEHLDLAFSDGFIDTFDVFRFSGDSGRTSDLIARRPRREFNSAQLEQVRSSSAYRMLCDRLHYSVYTDDQPNLEC